MASSSRRRAGGIAILATVVGLTVAPAVSAQATQLNARTSLSIRIADTRIQPGESGEVSGHLAIQGDVPAEGRTVTLEARALGSTDFIPVAEEQAGTNGGVDAIVTPDVTTRYRWRYAGDADTRPSHSGVATLHVGTLTHLPHRIGTSLSIREVHRTTDAGIVDVVRGSLRAGPVGLPHRPVVLLGRVAGSDGWTYEGTHLSAAHGAVEFVVDPTDDTTYRLAFLGTARLQPARSGLVRVAARPDITIVATPDSIPVGETTTISGVVTDHGAALAGATVELWATKVGRPHSTQKVGTGVTAADGSVAITDAPRRSTKYQLRLVGGDGVTGSLSAAALVTVTPVPVPAQ